MHYHLHEGVLDIPSQWQDNSLNVLQASQTEAFNLVINRDIVPKDNDPKAYLNAQWGTFAKELNGFARLSEHPIDNPEFHSTALEYLWETPEGVMHQINALRLSNRLLMSFTFTTPRPWTDPLREKCLAVLNSFQARTDETKT